MLNKKYTVTSQDATFNTIFRSVKKGISPVVSTALLLVVAVVAVIGFQGWYQTFSSNLFVSAEQDSSNLDGSSPIENIIGETLYLRAGENLTVSSLKIDGNDCNINQSYQGTIGIDVSDCLSGLTSSTPEIVLVTDQRVESKKVYLDENITDNELQPLITDTFISTWNTTISGGSNDTIIYLPLIGGGNYNFTVSSPNLIGNPVQITSDSDNLLNFSNPGVHTIEITGTIEGWQSPFFGSSKYEILEISQWGPLKLIDGAGYFRSMANLKITATDILNITGLTSMDEAFQGTYYLEEIPNIHLWDFSLVTDMTSMFRGAANFNQSIPYWSNLGDNVNMFEMFRGATSFNGDISSWNVSGVTNMGVMFMSATSFNRDISSWNVSNVTNMGGMFSGASNFTQNLSSWCVEDIPSKPSNFDLNAGFENITFLQPDWGVVC